MTAIRPDVTMAAALERFQAKWKPVRVKKMRQIKNLEPRFDSIETEKALAAHAILQQPKPHQAFRRSHNSLLVRTRHPAQHAAGLRIAGVLDLAELGQDLLHRGVAKGGDAH